MTRQLLLRGADALEAAAVSAAKTTQGLASSLKAKLDAALATLDSAAQHASTVKGLAASVREELTAALTACEDVQTGLDRTVIKAEASRQAAVKRPPDGGGHASSPMLGGARAEEIAAALIKKDAELQSTIKALQELWGKHEVGKRGRRGDGLAGQMGRMRGTSTPFAYACMQVGEKSAKHSSHELSHDPSIACLIEGCDTYHPYLV